MTATNTTPNTIISLAATPAPGSDTVLDIETLAADLFEKLVKAQLDLLRARSAHDQRAADTHRLCVRATALLLACLPTHPDSNAYRLKVMGTVALREQDGDEASHAWLMAERALVLDQQRQTNR